MQVKYTATTAKMSAKSIILASRPERLCGFSGLEHHTILQHRLQQTLQQTKRQCLRVQNAGTTQDYKCQIEQTQ